ncbi:MAG: sporulation integral membrane protein YtvI [Clostridia bacterium]
MVVDMHYWSKVLKKLLWLALSVIGIYLAFKLAIFYMPFLIAFIIALMIEPIIRFLMKHVKLKRKASAILVFVIALSIIIGLLAWGVITLISESSNLLNGLNGYFEKISNQFQSIMSQIDLSKLHVSNDILNMLQTSGTEVLGTVSEWVKSALTGLLNVITSLPTIGVYTVVCILALYFICTDKIYMLDQLEHHLPELWVKRIGKHVREIVKSLGCFVKAEGILVLGSFIICLIGLYIFKFVGLNVEFPLIAALLIGFVDALPIFGSATVMIPWAIIVAFNGDLTLGVSLIVLLIIMGMVRQFMEPRVVAGQIGIHPIFTLIAMYTGFRFMGVIGMLIGPIILIILKDIYATIIDKGVMKAIFDRE